MSLDDHTLRAYVAARSLAVRTWDRVVKDEQGEGVISAAIAVLVMAFLGAAMWVAFQVIFNNASDRVAENVDKIGS